MARAGSKAFPVPEHDHAACIGDAMAMAEDLCRENGLRFTRLRRQVFELVWTSHAPLGAYDLLAMLNERGQRAAPMTIYRALDFLMAHGLVHRLNSRNAYIGCNHPGDGHAGQFLICRDCGRVAEIEERRIAEAVRDGASRAGFDVRLPVIEIEGQCFDCQGARHG